MLALSAPQSSDPLGPPSSLPHLPEADAWPLPALGSPGLASFLLGPRAGAGGGWGVREAGGVPCMFLV